MVNKETGEIIVRCAGNREASEIYASPTVHWCGKITDGVSLRFAEDNGPFVIAFADLEELYKAAAKFRQEHPESKDHFKYFLRPS